MAVFIAEFTTDGAKYNPSKNCLFSPKDGPTSLPSPGTFNLSAHNLIKSFLPVI